MAGTKRKPATVEEIHEGFMELGIDQQAHLIRELELVHRTTVAVMKQVQRPPEIVQAAEDSPTP